MAGTIGDSAQTEGPSRYDCDFGDIKVSALDAGELTNLMRARLRSRQKLLITFINPDYARRAFQDDRLRSWINGFDLVLVDGNGVRWMTPLFGFRVPERLDTDGVAPRLLSELAAAEARVFLFGCAPGVAEDAATQLTAAYPSLDLAGVEHGYWDVERGHPGRFDPADNDRIVGRINSSGADFVLVSLPTPLQQRWVIENKEAIAAPVIMTGGSFLDHVADNERWPESWYPEWANRYSLNWLYRLKREPGRLWRRYTLEMVHFAALALQARWNRSR